MRKNVDKAFNIKSLYSIEHFKPVMTQQELQYQVSKDSSKRPPACPSAAALQLLLLSWVLQPEICQLTLLQEQQPEAQEQQWKVAAAISLVNVHKRPSLQKSWAK